MKPLTEEQTEIANYYLRPAGIDIIINYLERLSMRKRVDSKDPNRIVYIMADDAQRLSRLEVTELDMVTMIEHFIENDTSDFYPQYAKIKKQIGK